LPLSYNIALYRYVVNEVHGKIFDLTDGPEQKIIIAVSYGYDKTSIII
jgi:hypothetical protein